MDFLSLDKEKMKRNQVRGRYFKGLKTKIGQSIEKDIKLAYLIKVKIVTELFLVALNRFLLTGIE